jgi:PIN domain nuclease of toxin-antitoxin system
MALVADTHALVWYVEASPQLSTAAMQAIQSTILRGEPIYISAVSLVEIQYLIEKGKLASDLFDRLMQMLRRGNTGLTETPFTLEMADRLRQVSRAQIPDMPDRMITATALHLGLALVTRDQRIQAAGVLTVW